MELYPTISTFDRVSLLLRFSKFLCLCSLVVACNRNMCCFYVIFYFFMHSIITGSFLPPCLKELHLSAKHS
ncbi:hypothetical protein GCK32_021590 [Trichostrongylus colubriformis]|uniref:Uncharacterized protein n=1 Tax=Trichostrongylus colubriformis TaxID=6319 RepID=A0AAN8F0Z6_TRICO